MPKLIKDRYEIKETLGRGGMGVIYKAYDTVLKRDVAIKTLRDVSDPAAIEMFHKEYQVLASISHPNIVAIFDIGELEEEGSLRPYFIMPLLPGVTLDNLIRTASHRLTVERSVDIISQTCRGLQAAHEQGLVHRDLKPSNILVMDDDSVKIIDFGVAHVPDTHSRTGMKGTLLYMSPEQIEMKSPSALSDIFSLGVVAYETLTQRRPFEATGERDIVEAILHRIPPPASELNPAVNQAISQVVHKAMAKQPYHRFSTAREFADTLQKAFHNEPIEIFDPARMQPRIQRATKAFEQADYQFAEEILSELEAEGHLDPAISLLRLKIDHAVRQKRILQLLDSARTRMEEDEYPLALHKVQEVLDLDPNNATALTLKGSIEEKRNQSKIEDWFRLARQHIDNHAYTHARQALQNVLQLKPKDTQAIHLLAEVDHSEQEYKRVRQEKEQFYQAALAAYGNGEISAALAKLERVMELDRQVSDSSAPDRAASYQTLYNQVRSEHDAINRSYQEARKHLTDHNFALALATCEQYLAKYPGHALFQALKFDIEEQQRQELSARIAEIDRQVEAEADLDKRVNILKEALDQYPGEAHFERSLRIMREKRDLVNSIVTKARLHEERGQLNDAIGQWEILRTIYSQYPGLSFEIDRVQKRREQQARSEAKTRWVEQVDRHMETRDYPRALELLQQAQREFPDDAELAELEKSAQQGMNRAGEAMELMARGQELCQQGNFDEGLAALRKAHEQDQLNPAIQQTLVDTLVNRARTVLETDWRTADALLQQSLDLEPAHALAKSLRTLALDRKREEFIDRLLAHARRLQGKGDLQGALTQVQQALSSYGNEPRLAQVQSTLTKELADLQRRESRRRDLEELKRLDGEAEAVANLASVATLRERIESISRQYADDSEVQSITKDLERHLGEVAKTLEAPPPAETKAVTQPPASLLDNSTPTVALPAEKGPSEDATVFHPRAMGPEGEDATLLAAAPPVAGAPTPPVEKETPTTVPLGTAMIHDAEKEASSLSPTLPPDLGATVTSAPTPSPTATPPPPAPVLVPKPTQPARALKLAAAFGGLTRKRSTWILAGVAAVALIAVGAILLIHFFKGGASGPTMAVEVMTSPPGAIIRINNEDRGNSPVQIELHEGTYQLEAVKAGYHPVKQTMEVKLGSATPVQLTLQPLPQAITIATDMEAGKVLLDGQPAGNLQEGQLTLDNVTFQAHKLQISGPQGQATVSFQSALGAAPTVNPPLGSRQLRVVAVSSLGGQLTIQSSFRPLKAGLDAQPPQDVGPQGLTLNGQSLGTHELVLDDGKQERKLSVDAGLAPLLTVFINSNRNVGSLLVQTNEDGARVFLNDRPYRRPIEHGELRIANLNPGQYTVRVAKDGFEPEAEQRATIEEGQETKLVFALRPMPSVASLVIHGALAGTQVLLDSASLGTVQADGSFTDSNVSPGGHTIELRLESYKPKHLSRQFTAGQATELAANDVSLERLTGILLINISPPASTLTLSPSGGGSPRDIKPGRNVIEAGMYIVTAQWGNKGKCSKPADVKPGELNPAIVTLNPGCK